MEDIPARDVFDESLYLIRARADQEGVGVIDQTRDEHLPLLFTDSTRLIQVLINLMTNAVKYNRKGGTVTLSCEQLPEHMLRINIIDNGIGIPRDQQDSLFQPFERLGHELSQIDGTGIGLSITRQIVEILGGQIGFESVEDKGSTFWVDIPMSIEQASVQKTVRATDAAKPDEEAARDDGPTQTVLYIEDNPDSLHLVEAIVSQFGNIRMLTAENATVGYDLSTSQKPDLILMDINLPGMNGIQALKRLQQTRETRDIPVIAVTSNTMPKDVEAGLKAGFAAYITKPIKVSEFIQTIDQTLNNARQFG